MAVSIRSSSSAAVASRRSQVPAGARRSAVVVRAVQENQASRRDVLLGGIVALTTLTGSLSLASPAQAFLGFGEDDKLQEKYSASTSSILTNVRSTLDLPKDDPEKEAKVTELRKEINTWVAAYRREPKVSGRPSYGNTYSVLNALAGHFNSFGPTAPIPKKRLERINKEINDASLFLSRGR